MWFNITTSILILLLSMASLGGATVAWFLSEQSPTVNSFTAGTVVISTPIIEGSQEWQPGLCETVTWNIENTGTKSSYIRVRIIEEYDQTVTSETAWAVGTRFGGGFAQYFEYKKGTPYEVILGAGVNLTPVGKVSVWDNGTNLYIKYTTYDYVSLTETHLYAGLLPPTNSAPGQLGWQETPVYPYEQLYIRDYVFDSQTKPIKTTSFSKVKRGTTIYIAAHATVSIHPVTPVWNPGAFSHLWIEGIDGYYYYSVPVAAGETISISFEVCLPDNMSRIHYSFNLEADAVQSSNNAVHDIWPNNPY